MQLFRMGQSKLLVILFGVKVMVWPIETGPPKLVLVEFDRELSPNQISMEA